jgi:hypothetical protein
MPELSEDSMRIGEGFRDILDIGRVRAASAAVCLEGIEKLLK